MQLNKDIYANGEGCPPDQEEPLKIVFDEDMEKKTRMGLDFDVR